MPKGSAILIGGEEQLVKWSCPQLCVWVAMILPLFTLSTKLLKIHVWGWGNHFLQLSRNLSPQCLVCGVLS